MQRDYAQETAARVAWLQQALTDSHATGFVFANSGGKDCALAGILCRMATDNVLSVALPAGVARNYGEDIDDAAALAKQFDMRHITVDLGPAKQRMVEEIARALPPSDTAVSNIAPRLRMTTVYTLGQTLGYLVAGTGNRSERAIGYFTKWGDGAFDVNPIADLTVHEIYAFLAHLHAPENIIKKAPSAGLFEGQTDEGDMGLTYAAIDRYLETGEGDAQDIAKIQRMQTTTAHKRRLAPLYPDVLP